MHELFVDVPAVFYAFAFIVALLVGSFLNVVIYRLPLMMEREWRAQCEEINATPAGNLPEGRFDLVAPRSSCPSCGHRITAMQNIPVVSFLLLGGKCAACKVPISPRYPAVELLTGVLSAIVAWRFGFGWEAAAGIALTWSLVAISAIDIDHQLIPDSISLPLIWAGLVLSLFSPLAAAEMLFISPIAAIVGAVAGYLSLWSIYHLFRLLTGKEGMGYGDFKLLAALGAWLGWQMLFPIVIAAASVGALAGVSAMLVRKHKASVPMAFGPYLAAAGWLMLVFGPQLMDSYLGLYGAPR
jgi:leader peptidase (prepilin peptidase)/N-methyltransferase